ncbi:NAD-binding component of Kef-type K+ transport system [Cytophagales bacterium WSM2-2]|nr:NAD-binding component of Kef-type K+ transport system [Cytophagales bacterium WSM2-2]
MKRPNYRRVLITSLIFACVYGGLLALLLRLEAGAPQSKLNNVQDAMWYMVETLTTVGYGDALPVTYWGRMIGFIFLLSSLGVYGFVIGQIANFMSTLKEQKELGLNGSTFKNHVVIIGWNDFGQSVISHLIGAGRQVAVITKDRGHIEIIREYYAQDQVFTLFSDYNNFDQLEKANIREASIVFINLNDDTEKLVYIINIKKHYDNLNYVVTLDNGNLKNTFIHAGVTYTISKNEISSKLLASYIYEPDVASFSEELIAYAHEEDEYDMKQFLVKPDNAYANTPYDKAFFELKRDCNVVLIGLVKQANGQRRLLKNPEGSIKIEPGDYLLMMMDGKGWDRLRKIFRVEEGI